MNSSHPYFSLPGDKFEMTLGTRPLGQAQLIEVDEHYRAEIAQRENILAEEHSYYFQALAGSEAAQWETIETILPLMARDYPEHFALDCQNEVWTWQNRLLDQTITFRLGDAASLPYAPLDWLGRQVQEDLLLLDGNDPECPLIAGQLCFASRWSLGEKMGLSMMLIHGPVPEYAERIGKPVDLLMARLKPNRPVWRINWSLHACPNLNLAPKHGAYQDAQKLLVTAQNAGERCYYRVERQGLLKLPRSNAILFTIHSYLASIGHLAADPVWAQRMAGILRTSPPSFIRYKGLPVYLSPLLAYLDSHSA